MRSRVIASGYGAQALSALGDVVAEAKRDDPMAPVTLLLPNNIAGIVARRHLAQGLTDDGKGVAGLYLATLPRLGEQLAAPALTPRRPATRPIVASAWRAALDHEPGVFAQVADHPATIRALTSAHRELRDLGKEALDTVADASPLAADVVRLHREVTAALEDGWYDVTHLLWAAVGVVDAKPGTAAERGALVLYLPQALTRAESEFARRLAAHADLTVVAGLTRVERGDRAVRRTLQSLGVDDPRTDTKPPTAHRVLHASDSDDEVRCVVRDVARALEATAAHRVAVLYGSAQPYARLLHEHLSASGITFNGPGTLAVHERAIARGLLGILALPERDYGRGEVFQALSNAPVYDLVGERAPVSRWERVSRLAAVVRGDDWDKRLTTYIQNERTAIADEEASDDPYQGRIDRARHQIETADSLRDFAGRLRLRLDEGSNLTTWADLSRWALRLFRDLYGEPESMLRLPAEEQYAAAAVDQTLRSLVGLDSFEARASLHGLREVLELELEAALPRVGRFGEGVFVGSLSSAVGLDADRVFVLGLAEDAYPGRLHEDALLPERVRSLTDELEAARERLDAKQRHVLAAFEAAPHVTASFPRGDLRRSTGRLPSRFLLPTIRELADDKQLPATEWGRATSKEIVSSRSYAHTMRTSDSPASEQEWRVRAMSADVPLHDSTVDAAVEMVRARATEGFTRYDGNLRGVDGIPDYAHSERRVSPTALEAYADCPHAYFVQRLLRVEALEHPEEIIAISPLEVGNLVHRTMDIFVREYEGSLPSYGQPWTTPQRVRLLEIADATVRDFEARGVTGHQLLWEQERTRIMVDLAAMLDDDDAWRRDRDARVHSSELAFGKDGEPPVIIDVPGGGRVHIRGSADKVDETRGGVLLVTDIKTGSTRNFKDIEDDPVVGGTKLQLPAYAQAARQILRAEHAEAQYWFVRRDRGTRITVPLDAAVQRLYAETVGTLVASIAAGLFPAKAPDNPDFMWVQCEYCNPDSLGHGDARTRWERKRRDPALREYVGLVEPGALVDGGDAS